MPHSKPPPLAVVVDLYVQWAQENDVSAEVVAQRQAWIAELEARRNPFDEQTLESLR